MKAAIMSVQLAFPFAGDDPPRTSPSRTTLYWRRRIDRAVRRAYELGKRQYQRRPADIAPPSPIRAAYPNGDAIVEAVEAADDRNELVVLARRSAISRSIDGIRNNGSTRKNQKSRMRSCRSRAGHETEGPKQQ